MKYQQIQPSTSLAPYVRYFWTLEGDCALEPVVFRPIADGCPGLIFQSAGNPFSTEGIAQMPAAFLYGQTTQQIEMMATGRFATIGVYMYPDALKSVFGLDADEWTDGCIDLPSLLRKQDLHLSEQLLNTPSLTGRIEILSAWLLSQVNQHAPKADKVTLHIVRRISSGHGKISLQQLQQEVQLTERSFERRFKQHIGISAKLFSRICRFQASLDQLRHQRYQKLSDIAYELDYADQSHFIRAFKEFAGVSPYQFHKQSREIVENFPIVTK